MKYLIACSFLCIFACHNDGDKEYILPLRDTIPTIEMFPQELAAGNIPTDLNKLLPDQQCPEAFITLEMHVVGDSVVGYTLNYRCVEKRKSTSVAPKTYGVIQSQDTKTKIAARLGVHVNQIKNKEPLKVGERIICQK